MNLIEWQFAFRNASEKVLVSLKCIIRILTVFITQAYSFQPVRSDLSYNNLITLKYALSPTLLNDLLHVLTDIMYYTYNPSYIRLILTPGRPGWFFKRCIECFSISITKKKGILRCFSQTYQTIYKQKKKSDKFEDYQSKDKSNKRLKQITNIPSDLNKTQPIYMRMCKTVMKLGFISMESGKMPSILTSYFH